MESALQRGLKEYKVKNANSSDLTIIGGGPSIAETFDAIKGRVMAVNGAHDWLISKGIVPKYCAFADPTPEIADIVTPHKDVTYLVASICDPSVFDWLKHSKVILWHCAGQHKDEQEILYRYGSRAAYLVGGGGAIGIRTICLAYGLGYRNLHLHGLDSSLRAGYMHAYDGDVDGRQTLRVGDHDTTHALMAQVQDFFATLGMFAPNSGLNIEIYGNGLLQDCWREFRRENPHAFTNKGN